MLFRSGRVRAFAAGATAPIAELTATGGDRLAVILVLVPPGAAAPAGAGE